MIWDHILSLISIRWPDRRKKKEFVLATIVHTIVAIESSVWHLEW